MNNKAPVITQEAMDQVVIPMIEAFILALESKSTKNEIKEQVVILLDSAKKAASRITTAVADGEQLS